MTRVHARVSVSVRRAPRYVSVPPSVCLSQVETLLNAGSDQWPWGRATILVSSKLSGDADEPAQDHTQHNQGQ